MEIKFLDNRGFFKECVLVAFFVLNSLLFYLYLKLDNDLLDSIFNPLDFKHRYFDHQSFVWAILSHFQPLLYLSVLFFLSKRRFKYSLLFLFYWISYGIFYELLYWEIDTQIINAEVIKLYILLGAASLLLIYKVGQFTGRVGKDDPFKKVDIIPTLIIISLPIFAKLIWNMPRSVESMSFLGYQISAGEWPNLCALFWYILIKMFVCVPLVICYLTITNWWRYSLLFPILLAVFQLVNGINPNVRYADENEIWQAIPYLTIVFLILLFLARAAYYQSRIKLLYKNTVAQIEQNKERLFDTKYNNLRHTWKGITRFKSKEESISDLKDLRDELERQLEKY